MVTFTHLLTVNPGYDAEMRAFSPFLENDSVKSQNVHVLRDLYFEIRGKHATEYQEMHSVLVLVTS